MGTAAISPLVRISELPKMVGFMNDELVRVDSKKVEDIETAELMRLYCND